MSGKEGGSAAKKPKVDGGSSEQHSTPEVSLKGTFIRDLIPMMFGFGDVDDPMPETADVLEECVILYSTGVLKKALDLSAQRGRVRPGGKATGPPTADDILAIVRKDLRKSQRVEELLIMQKEIKMTTDHLEGKDEESLAKMVDE